MSAIAGLVELDGKPVAPGQLAAMTAAMRHRGPDGVYYWLRGNVGLGQCMLRTTPESLEEILPLANEDASAIVVMDGRVDNYQELRRELLSRGAVLRNRSDAELVLRAYEVWGENCPDRIIGELVFFVWDARRQRLFAARDAAGTRHFYYHWDKGRLAFASEIKGLLALDGIERRLNESRMLDFLGEAFDRDDEVGTFYQGISRLPAGHSMEVSQEGVRVWRYWWPDRLPEAKYASQEECTEAFMDQLRVAVKCRLRSIKPVGAMLSGGLDSSSIVGLISKDFRGDLQEPLQTFSLIREDRENCPDWRSIDAILKADDWLRPTIINTAVADDFWRPLLSRAGIEDDPFALSLGFTYRLAYEAARGSGCGVLLDGMAGDSLFYSPGKTVRNIVQQRHYRHLPAALSGYKLHDQGRVTGLKASVRALLGDLAPQCVRAISRLRSDRTKLSERGLRLLRRDISGPYLRSKRTPEFVAGKRTSFPSDQAAHAAIFMSGALSFAHEVYGASAFANGVEPRSPFSDRRMIEFAIRMPIAAKLATPWYKSALREGTAGMLPDDVRWRCDTNGHPGWPLFERLVSNVARFAPELWDAAVDSAPLKIWIDPAEALDCRDSYARCSDVDSGVMTFNVLVAAQWLARQKIC